MNNQWNNNQFQQGLPSQGNQVQMFDPTKFQAPAAYGGSQTSKPRLHARQQNTATPIRQQSFGAPTTQQNVSAPITQQIVGTSNIQKSHDGQALQHASSVQDANSSWSSWSSWDWNPEANNPQLENQSQQNQQAQQSVSTGFEHQVIQNDEISCNQYYGESNYSNTWNQGWDAGSQYAQPQGYSQPDSGALYQSPETQPQQTPWDHQQYTGDTYSQGQHDRGTVDQVHYNTNDPIATHQQHSQQNQLSFSGQFYDPQQQQADQGHVYSQGYGQYQSQSDSVYSNPYTSGTWVANDESRQWVTGNQEQTDTKLNSANEQQVNSCQTTSSENISQPSKNSYTRQDTVVARPVFDIYNADDDGTVSGFFGRDDDGDVQLDPQRCSQSYGGDGSSNQGNDISSGLNQFLAVTSQYHRTDSEISNASLSTFNNSEDDDGKRHGQKIEEADLVQREQQDKNRSIVPPLSGDKSVIGQHHEQDVSRGTLQKQAREDYSEFSSSAYTQHNLPLDTNIRPSPDGDHPDSAESGGSGGSSGLADWEIVPAQIGSVNLSHSSSLDNTVSFLDKPDGGVSISSSYGNFEHPGKSSQYSQSHASFSTTSDDNPVSEFRNLNLSEPSLPHESQTTFVREPAQSHHDTIGQSGSSSITDPQQKNILTYTSMPPSQLSGGLHLTNIPLASQPDGTVNKNRKDGGNITGHSVISQSTNSSHPSSNASFNFQGAWQNERIAATSSHQSFNSEKPRDLTTAPLSKPKLPATSEDGSRNSNHDNDPNIKSSDTKQAKGVFQNTEETAMSSHQQRHHSAFQPVGRQQQSTMSPATALWDNSDAPTANILLAPVLPLIIPTLNPYSASPAAVATQNTAEVSTSRTVGETDKIRTKPLSKEPNTSASSVQSRVNERKTEQDRGKEQTEREDNNHSFDSLDEIDAVVEGKRDKNSRNQQNIAREPSYPHSHDRQDTSRHDFDRPLSRNNRPRSRGDDIGQYHYVPQQGRKEAYSKDDPYRKQRDYYKDNGDSSYDDRYDRPQSRQDESRGSRPSSRSTQEVSRPRSRADYDQDRDYYNRARQRGYSYDTYGRNVDYYNDERERYYRYKKEKEARYTQAYYEEYYGAKYAEYYKQLQQHHQLWQQQHQNYGGRASSQDSDRSSSHSQSRGSTPAIDNSPGMPSSSPGPDYYGSRDSHHASHTDYSRDHYNRGYSYEDYNAYYDGYSYGYPGYDEYNKAYDQGRMTPPKYSYPHVRASFGPGGQLIKVLPNRPKDGQPAILDILDIQMVLENCSEAEELKKFPGPLTRGTHKKDVLLFCQQKARACGEDINMMDRESAQLIWRFLELLIKQNGSVVGTDLADLLLEGHEPSTHEYSLHGMKISQSPEALDVVPEVNSEDGSSARDSPAIHVTSDKTSLSIADREREKWVDRFRHLLLYGRKKDALECAMKNNLWGHALFLASKMDPRTHASVMTRFANSAMKMNDPLQTLYQLMSGRQPAAVTCVVDERWGDWRPHLAMILSNQSSDHDINRKSITTLADTLAAKGYLHASHFCYLMAQINFGNYFKKTSKIVLISSSHNLSMEEFATNEAIQCTEVYEYAQTLGNPSVYLPHLQIYKYMYACRLTDYGMVPEALHYCEVIANNIQQNPTWFQVPFARLVCELSQKLFYSDAQQQSSGEEEASHLWLQQLKNVCGAYDDGSIQPLSGKDTPAVFPETTASSESGDYYNQAGHRYSADAAALNLGHGAPGNDVYGHQPQSHSEMPVGQDVNALTGQMQNWESTDQQEYTLQQQQQGYYQQHQYDYNQWQQQTYGNNYTGYEDLQQQQQYEQPGEEQTADAEQLYHQTAQQGCEPLTAYSGTLPEDNGHCGIAETNNCPDDLSSLGGSYQDSTSSSTQPASQPPSQGYGGYEMEQQLPPRASTTEASEDDEDDGGDIDDDALDGSAAGFDYFGNVGTQKVVAPPHRYRSMSGSSTGSTRRRRTISGSSTGSVKVSPHKPATQQQPAGGKGSDKGKKGSQQDNGGSGWFGGLFNKFKAKDKNEMILPDDKNPPIVWDPVKKKWINADGTEEDVAPKAPPPKDTDLMGKPLAPTSMAPPPSVLTEGNRFSLKAKGVKNQYVDVNNPKPMSVPQSLFNVGSGTTLVTTAGNFPTSAPQYPGSGQASSTETSISNVENNLVISQDPGSQGTDITTTANVSHQVPSMPILFNPASLKKGSAGGGSTSSAAGPGLKYGQRRAYPK